MCYQILTVWFKFIIIRNLKYWKIVNNVGQSLYFNLLIYTHSCYNRCKLDPWSGISNQIFSMLSFSVDLKNYSFFWWLYKISDEVLSLICLFSFCIEDSILNLRLFYSLIISGMCVLTICRVSWKLVCSGNGYEVYCVKKLFISICAS